MLERWVQLWSPIDSRLVLSAVQTPEGSLAESEEEEAKVMVDFNETVTKQFNDTNINDHGNDDNDQVLTHHQQKQDTVFKLHSFL